jgi:hypothetical protein
VCGSIYNFYAEKPDVVLIIDEIAEAINEQVIQILNMGRGAGFKAFVAFQARADLEAKLGNAAKMLQVLGNLNNQINRNLWSCYITIRASDAGCSGVVFASQMPISIRSIIGTASFRIRSRQGWGRAIRFGTAARVRRRR